jgi:cell division initiation protein
MELTPLDLRNQTFKKKSFGGYDPEEVHAFLNQAAMELEKQARQRTELTERLKIAEERVGFYKQLEKTLQDSVITMQKTVDDIKHNADREAELIIAEAKARAVREVEETKKRSDDLRSEIEVLKQQKTNYFIRIRALIRGQEELLEAMEREKSEHKSPEELAAEAMVFRNKRLEQATQRKTGPLPTVAPTQQIQTQAPPVQAQAPVAPVQQMAPQPAPQAQQMQQAPQAQPARAPQTQSIPVVPPAGQAQAQSRPGDPWSNPWGPYGQPPTGQQPIIKK